MTPPGERRSGQDSERFMVLQMVQDGTITIDEGARLLEAMGRAERAAPAPPPAPVRKPYKVHILVTSTDGTKEVDLHLPIGLVDMGIKVASKFAGDRLSDVPNFRAIAESGFTGKLLDINEGNDRIEITLE